MLAAARLGHRGRHRGLTRVNRSDLGRGCRERGEVLRGQGLVLGGGGSPGSEHLLVGLVTITSTRAIAIHCWPGGLESTLSQHVGRAIGAEITADSGEFSGL